MSEHYFTCPKCGGHHFGRDITADLEGADTVQCHNRVDGQPFIDDLKDWIDADRPKQKACGWRGVWPVVIAFGSGSTITPFRANDVSRGDGFRMEINGEWPVKETSE